MSINTKDFGKACKRYREDIGLTQKELSEQSGITRDNISKFEQGLNRNYQILMEYVTRGFDIDFFLMEVELNGKKENR